VITGSRQLIKQRLRLCQIGRVEALGEPAVDRPSPYSGDMHHGVVILALQVSTDRVAGDICRRAVVIDLEVAADRIGVDLNSGSVISDRKFAADRIASTTLKSCSANLKRGRVALRDRAAISDADGHTGG